MEPMQKTEEEWKKELSPEEYLVLRKAGTEAPFTGEYVENHADGVYRCKACGNILFTSKDKFDSGSGWPSFSNPAVSDNIGVRTDESHGTRLNDAVGQVSRTEVYCKNCGGHLGHLFDDGPEDAGGKRYCINSVSLQFEEDGK